MTFDDGIVKIYDVANAAEPGALPVDILKNPKSLYFKEETLGVTRFYEAIKANQRIERVISIYREDINTNQMAMFENGEQYAIRMIQADEDEFGIKTLRLSLERSGINYEVSE